MNQALFKEVNNMNDLLEFINIWLGACQDKDYISEKLNVDGKHYVVLDENRKGIGTVEIGPFTPGGFTTLEEYFDFPSLKYLVDNRDKVYEIDKLCLTKEARGLNYISRLFSTIAIHSMQYGGRYYIAAIESRLCRALMKHFGFKVDIVGEEKKYGSFSLLPIVVDFSEISDKVRHYIGLVDTKSLTARSV